MTDANLQPSNNPSQRTSQNTQQNNIIHEDKQAAVELILQQQQWLWIEFQGIVIQKTNRISNNEQSECNSDTQRAGKDTTVRSNRRGAGGNENSVADKSQQRGKDSTKGGNESSQQRQVRQKTMPYQFYPGSVNQPRQRMQQNINESFETSFDNCSEMHQAWIINCNKSVTLTNPIDETAEEPKFKVTIDMERNFMKDENDLWIWHKSWNLPNISVTIELFDRDTKQELLLPDNVNAKIFSVKKNCDPSIKVPSQYQKFQDKQKDLVFEDVELNNDGDIRLVNSYGVFSGLKFKSTSFNQQNYPFHLVIVLYIGEPKDLDTNGSPHVLSSHISPPIFINSRKLPHETVQKNNSSSNKIASAREYLQNMEKDQRELVLSSLQASKQDNILPFISNVAAQSMAQQQTQNNNDQVQQNPEQTKVQKAPQQQQQQTSSSSRPQAQNEVNNNKQNQSPSGPKEQIAKQETQNNNNGGGDSNTAGNMVQQPQKQIIQSQEGGQSQQHTPAPTTTRNNNEPKQHQQQPQTKQSPISQNASQIPPQFKVNTASAVPNATPTGTNNQQQIINQKQQQQASVVQSHQPHSFFVESMDNSQQMQHITAQQQQQQQQQQQPNPQHQWIHYQQQQLLMLQQQQLLIQQQQQQASVIASNSVHQPQQEMAQTQLTQQSQSPTPTPTGGKIPQQQTAASMQQQNNAANQMMQYQAQQAQQQFAQQQTNQNQQVPKVRQSYTGPILVQSGLNPQLQEGILKSGNLTAYLQTESLKKKNQMKQEKGQQSPVNANGDQQQQNNQRNNGAGDQKLLDYLNLYENRHDHHIECQYDNQKWQLDSLHPVLLAKQFPELIKLYFNMSKFSEDGQNQTAIKNLLELKIQMNNTQRQTSSPQNDLQKYMLFVNLQQNDRAIKQQIVMMIDQHLKKLSQQVIGLACQSNEINYMSYKQLGLNDLQIVQTFKIAKPTSRNTSGQILQIIKDHTAPNANKEQKQQAQQYDSHSDMNQQSADNNIDNDGASSSNYNEYYQGQKVHSFRIRRNVTKQINNNSSFGGTCTPPTEGFQDINNHAVINSINTARRADSNNLSSSQTNNNNPATASQPPLQTPQAQRSSSTQIMNQQPRSKPTEMLKNIFKEQSLLHKRGGSDRIGLEEIMKEDQNNEQAQALNYDKEPSPQSQPRRPTINLTNPNLTLNQQMQPKISSGQIENSMINPYYLQPQHDEIGNLQAQQQKMQFGQNPQLQPQMAYNHGSFGSVQQQIQHPRISDLKPGFLPFQQAQYPQIYVNNAQIQPSQPHDSSPQQFMQFFAGPIGQPNAQVQQFQPSNLHPLNIQAAQQVPIMATNTNPAQGGHVMTPGNTSQQSNQLKNCGNGPNGNNSNANNSSPFIQQQNFDNQSNNDQYMNNFNPFVSDCFADSAQRPPNRLSSNLQQFTFQHQNSANFPMKMTGKIPSQNISGLINFNAPAPQQ